MVNKLGHYIFKRMCKDATKRFEKVKKQLSYFEDFETTLEDFRHIWILFHQIL